MDKHNVIYSCAMTQQEKSIKTDISNTVFKFRNYAERKKPYTKEYIVYDFIYMKFQNLKLIYAGKQSEHCPSGSVEVKTAGERRLGNFLRLC